MLHRLDSSLEQQIALLQAGDACLRSGYNRNLGRGRFRMHALLSRHCAILAELSNAPIQVACQLSVLLRWLLLERQGLLYLRIVGSNELIELIRSAVKLHFVANAAVPQFRDENRGDDLPFGFRPPLQQDDRDRATQQQERQRIRPEVQIVHSIRDNGVSSGLHGRAIVVAVWIDLSENVIEETLLLVQRALGSHSRL